MYRSALFGITLVSLFCVFARAATPVSIKVDVNKPGVTISPMLNGLMTEEINHAFEGGLYAELIRNRAFLDDGQSPVHWSMVGHDAGCKLSLDRTDPLNAAHPVSLRLDVTHAAAVGVSNDGFWGIPVKPGTTYTASFYAKALNGSSGPLTVALVDDRKVVCAKAETQSLTGSWKKYSVTLKTAENIAASVRNLFVIYPPVGAEGSLLLSQVSLFPPTYMDRANGLRPDLMTMMSALHPAFLRMPGGNYLEGNTFPERFNWKQMIGPVDQRKGHMSCWGYRSTDGFGLPEYLTWCEQLKMEPVLAVFAGYTLNGDYVKAGPELKPYVDEALEEIEYVSGDAATPWGKRRADDGHPQSFKLHYIEVGNEDMYDKSGSYDGRFAQFFDALKARYPKLQIIATTHVKSRTPDVYDDHYYPSPAHLASDSTHYDNASRNGPKIFVGEWASQEGKPTPDLNAGLADAAWQMGLERNSDLVVMQAYAPLLVNVNPKAWQWPTNLIGYDALHSFGSPSYWAQSMLNSNVGNVVLPTHVDVPMQAAVAGAAPHGAIGVGTWDTQAEYKDIVVTSPDGRTLFDADLSHDTHGWTTHGGQWETHDSAIQQLAPKVPAWATVGDPAWTDYTLSLKARKLSGDEGFLILFRAVDADSYLWWNLGGWGNTRAQFQSSQGNDHDEFGSSTDLTIETGRWYDVKVQVQGHHLRGWLDGKRVSETTQDPHVIKSPLQASSTYDNEAGEVILKVVNLSGENFDGSILLDGTPRVASSAKLIELAGRNPTDTNTIDHPVNIVPKESTVSGVARKFSHVFPPYSLTLIRVKAAAE